MTPVVVRAPLRIDLAGSWRSAPLYARAYYGFTVSTAINRFCYVVVEEPSDGSISIDSADFRLSERCLQGVLVQIGEPLQIAKAALEHFGDRGVYDRGASVFLSSQAQPSESLGASSAMAVALVRALETYLGFSSTPEETAEVAGWIESRRLGLPGGTADHYVSALGGIRGVRTGQDTTVARTIAMPPGVRDELSRSILHFQVPMSAEMAAEEPAPLDPSATRALHELNALAEEMESALERGDLIMVGRLLAVGWEYHRRLIAPERASEMDALYVAAREVGAVGARIGRGDSLLLFAPPDRREHVRAAMIGRGLREMQIGFSEEGVQVLAGGSADPVATSSIVAERVFPRWSVGNALSSDRDRLRSS